MLPKYFFAMKLNLNSKIVLLGAIVLLSFIPPDKKRKFIDPANMDFTIKPGDNFYEYANGNWRKNNPIPGSKTRWGAFGIVDEDNTKRLHDLLVQESHKTTPDKFKKVGDYFLSGMDTATIEKIGYQPLVPYLDRINNLKNTDDLINEMIYERVNGISNSLIGIFIGQDRKDATKYISYIGQGGTSLPDRDYYLKNDPRSANIRKEYIHILQKCFSWLVNQKRKQPTMHGQL